MDILDFEGSATPVVMCEPNGRVIGKNAAARALTPSVKKGNVLNASTPLCRLPQGRCFAVTCEGRLWLIFCDFLRFDFDGAVFPTAREALLLSREALLRAIADHGALKKGKLQREVTRLRELLYSKFAFIFSTPSDPFRIHSTARLLKGFESVLPPTLVRFTAEGGSTRLVNTRNAVILLTSLISVLLPRTKGRVKADARETGEDLRLSVSAITDVPFNNASGEDLTELYPFFSEHSADLFASDLCARACGYVTLYETREDGGISIDVYVKTEHDLYSLLDPAEKLPFEEELSVIAKKLG